ncbi:MAG TPA: TetR/AcrR family transcriptional regulator [Stellaceae bacterium]|nr:TetR/AcrR family transcriptional regulator [Stellaceae bacterium]
MITDPIERASRWRRRKEARPGEILEAALACFAERGFAATRLDDVALRAGVTKGTLYLYFPNKEELLEAVVRQALVPNIEWGEALLDQPDEPAARLLERLLRSWAELALSPAGAIPKIIVSEAGNFPKLAHFYREVVVDRGLELMRRVLRLGVERGEFRAPDDFDNAVRCIFAPIVLAMLWRHSLGRHEDIDHFDPEAICRTQLKLLLDGLAITPAASPSDAPIDCAALPSTASASKSRPHQEG